MKQKLLLLLVCLLGIRLTAQEAFIGDTVQIEHYNIHLEVKNLSEGVLYGTAEATVISKLQNLSMAPFYLLNMNIDTVKVNGIPISDWQYDNLLLRVPLSPLLNIGDVTIISISYHGHPTIESYGWGGFHFGSTSAYNLGVAFDALPHCYGRSWFPCADDFITRSTYHLSVTTDADKKAICGGLLIDSTINSDNTITWQWNMNQLIPSYLVSVAVANYTEVEMNYAGINGDVPMYLHVSPNQVNAAQQLFDILPDVMQLFEQSWGAYPFDRVGFVSTGQGAMEHATNIAFPAQCFSPSVDNEQLFAHELSHAWFGDMVTCCKAEEMWWNEGWATYNEILFMERIYGDEAAQTYYKNMNKVVLNSAHSQDGGFYPLNNLPQEITYGTNAYKKGGVVVHTLRNYMGDELFFSAMTAFLQRYAYQAVCTEDLVNFLTEFTGIDMSHWFDGWVRHAGAPGFEIDSVITTQNGNQYQSTVYVEQKRFYGDFITEDNRVPVTLLNEDLSQETTVTVEFSGKTGFLSDISTNFDPQFAFIDYHDKMSDGLLMETQNISATGNISFGGNFKLVVDEITASSTIYNEYFLFEPDPMKNPLTGLILSNRNYWKISGTEKENFVAKGMFIYNKSNLNLDTIFSNPTENELVLMYRPNATYDWQIIPTTQYGGNTSGFLLVENVQWGEYCLAVKTSEYNAVCETVAENTFIQVFPNPTHHSFHFQLNKPVDGSILIYDVHGKQVDQFSIHAFQNHYQWTPKNLPAGVYFMKVMDKNHQIFDEHKLIFSK
ncbi:MAG: M1 family aminopeptidase [Bacteroidales bacterium]|nr:M1 family aminopeptidase [Bacteroidales bacterium]